jgi:pyruvate kinase
MSHRRTKIVCTLGPASNTPHMMSKLLRAGLDVARLNCSHASHGDLAYLVENFRRVSRLAGKPTALLLDLSGPKVRTGLLEGESMTLRRGERLHIRPGTAKGKDDWITCNYAGLSNDVGVGDRILLDDGLMDLIVVGVGIEGAGVVTTEIGTGGVLKPRKGMNLPDNTVSIPALTAKDRADLEVGLDLGVDYVALSFVQKRQDIIDLKEAMAAMKGGPIPIIAKIEKPQAIGNLDEIMAEVDGIMIARGDLAVEVGNHRVPVLQKEILRRTNNRGVIDIVATQMLESMTHNPRPTRAEASDVANAVLDGCDAVMLSGETASGDYPVEAVEMMDLIAREVEPWMGTDHVNVDMVGGLFPPITLAVVRAAAQIAAAGEFKALIVFTLSGRTALLLTGFFPGIPIFALTPNRTTERAMALYRNVVPVYMQFPANSDQMIDEGERILVERGFLNKGDEAIVVAGFTELRGVANMVKIVRI